MAETSSKMSVERERREDAHHPLTPMASIAAAETLFNFPAISIAESWRVKFRRMPAGILQKHSGDVKWRQNENIAEVRRRAIKKWKWRNQSVKYQAAWQYGEKLENSESSRAALSPSREACEIADLSEVYINETG